MNDLATRAGELVERANRISRMTDRELRQFAVEAANARDLERLWEIVEAYVVTKGRKKGAVSRGTLESYKHGVERLLFHWQGENLLRPSRDAGERYVLELQTGGQEWPVKPRKKPKNPPKNPKPKKATRTLPPLDAGTIQVRLAAARALYAALSWAGAWGEGVEMNPFRDVHAPEDLTPEEEKRLAYEQVEVEKMLFAATEEDAVIVALGADGGLRVSEMLSLRWQDVNLAGRTLVVRKGKGLKRRTVLLTVNVVEALEVWKQQTGGEPGERVLTLETPTGVRHRLRRLCSLSRVPYRGVHALRHTAGTWLYETTSDLRLAAKLLGHAKTATTEIYAKMDKRKLRAALDRRERILRPAVAA